MGGRRLLWILFRWLGRIIFLLAFRARAFGQINVPEKGGVLIVSNHQSYLDPILLGIGLDRSVSYMARDTLFNRPGFGTLIRMLNTFPVAPTGGDLAAVREAVRRLKNGWCLVVFPEGTRSPDGSVRALRPGIAVIARRACVPIVPAAVEGAFRAWPRGGHIRPHPVSVAYGRPLAPDACRRMTRNEFVTHLRESIIELQAALRKRAAYARGVAPPRDQT